MGLLTNTEHVTKETGPKVECFAGFCHHRLVTTSKHTHVYCYFSLESRMKTGLWTNALCIEHYNTKNNSKVDYSYNSS